MCGLPEILGRKLSAVGLSGYASLGKSWAIGLRAGNPGTQAIGIWRDGHEKLKAHLVEEVESCIAFIG